MSKRSAARLSRCITGRGAPQPTYPAERITKIAASLHDPTVPPETLARRAQSATETVTMAFHDDYVRDNAEFRSDAGFPCFIDRIADGGCCKWCDSLEGKYLYPDDVPKDVYRRHDRCHCTITYVNNIRGQNVWQQRLGFRELTDTETEFIKQTGFKKPWMVDYNIGSGIMKDGFKKPTISAEERERMLIAGMKKPQRLDIAGESGIIEEKITHNSAGKQVKTVKHINLQAEPNSITQKINSNGGIDRNYYDESGRQFKQVSNNDHNQPKKHPFGENGEHAHDYVYDDKGNLIDRPMRELNDDERKENEDIL